MSPGKNVIDLQRTLIRRDSAQFTPEASALKNFVPHASGHMAERLTTVVVGCLASTLEVGANGLVVRRVALSSGERVDTSGTRR
jgi:hypothetical protein